MYINPTDSMEMKFIYQRVDTHQSSLSLFLKVPMVQSKIDPVF